jgi:hypothetical protein
LTGLHVNFAVETQVCGPTVLTLPWFEEQGIGNRPKERCP